MMQNSVYSFVVFVFLNRALGEEFNLFGDAGQAYSVEVNLGHPPQKFNLLVDTGSTTLAIASQARQGGKSFFKANKSSSISDTGKQVQAKYSQGMWVGHLASDFAQFPSLPSVPEVRSDLALITESNKFFMNGSGWQLTYPQKHNHMPTKKVIMTGEGLLGLAYLPVGAWGENIVVESWLDSVDRTLKKPMSFQLKLCGVTSATNSTHYGNFQMLDDLSNNRNKNRTYRTPVLRKRWYEVGVLSVRVLLEKTPGVNDTGPTQTSTVGNDLNNEMCLKLNEEKSIVDSGTTNIRLPDSVFREIVDQIKNAVSETNVISDEFWYHGEAGCWPQPQQWALPWIAIDLLSADADNQYFTLEIPPENYMRVVSAGAATGAHFVCYKLGLEAGPETVLGYTAMEGLQVLFNRSAGWIGWQTSNCGPNARITGPLNVSTSLVDSCHLRHVAETAASIRAAQWALFVVSIIAGAVLVYLLAPCVKAMCKKPLRTQQISMSQAALVEQET